MVPDLADRVVVATAAGQESVDLEAAEDTDRAETHRATTSMAGMVRAAQEWAVDPERDRALGM
jgi:hypothetical protein